LARRYRRALTTAPVVVPPERDAGHVYHLFPILTPERDRLQAHLLQAGIGTLVHYPMSIPRQQALRHLPSAPCPVSERVAREVCSLPLHPNLPDADADFVAASVHAWKATLAK
jgi:dTDP-4-amino-4,6-dideoxygalactose transaminase